MGGELLRGWKEIAAFLQTSVRTAQRWEKQHGLPVERLPNDKGGVIVAHQQRIRLWQESAAGRVATDEGVSKLSVLASVPPLVRRRKLVGGIVAILAAVLCSLVGAVVFGFRPFGPDGLTADRVPSSKADATSVTQPHLRFRVILGDAKTAVEIGIPNSGAAMVSGDGGAGIWLRPTLREGGIDLEVSRDDSSGLRPPRPFATLRLERKGKARLNNPRPLEVEWLSPAGEH